MTSRDEALRALEKRWNDLGDEIMQGAGDLPDDFEGRMTARLLRLQADTVDRCRSELAAILSARQEVAPVAKRVETGVVQFGDDWPGIFIRGDNAFGLAMTLTCDEGPLRNAAIKSVVDLLSSCNVANNPKVRVIPSPAHTSEARDAAARNLLSALDQHMYPNDYCGYEVGKRDADAVSTAIEALRAAMRQESGSRE